MGFERARVTALLASAETSVGELETAVVRRAQGESSAACSSCGEPIGDERLSALPATRVCISCATVER